MNAIEYGLTAALIAVAIVACLLTIGPNIIHAIISSFS